MNKKDIFMFLVAFFAAMFFLSACASAPKTPREKAVTALEKTAKNDENPAVRKAATESLIKILNPNPKKETK